MKRLFIAIQSYLQKLLGTIRQSRRANLVAGFSASGVVVAAIVLAVVLSAGRKDTIRVVATDPSPRPLTENAAIPPLTITFSASAAKIELVGKELTQGVSITPDLKGKWIWSDDTTLVFFPQTDWLPGTGYTVRFSPSILSSKVKVSSTSVSFHAAALVGELKDV